ncbi:MAG: SgcJ/EcaC family oxidoreductase [Proteobacteria bacterium]|nr:SgcJ/EcaC family oxidoreductase [Pseudomonadota bacterium]
MESDAQQIRRIHAAWIEAVNAGDLGRLLALVTDDVVFLSPGAAPLDRAGFAAHFRTAQQQGQVHCHSELQEVGVAGDMAYARSRDALTVTPHAGGAGAKLAGHRLTLYRRQPDGRWLLARDAHTVTSGG